MRSTVRILALMLLVLGCGTLVLGQTTEVTAEAIGQANLRTGTDVNTALLGQIVAGTRYPVIGRSEFYPWVLIGDPATLQPIGWVFKDLVTIQGDLTRVPFTESLLGNAGPATLPVSTPVPITNTEQPPFGVALPTETPTSAVPAGVTGRASGEINIRFGPGADYPRIGVARPGDTFEITARHTQFSWLQIRYPAAPNGFGWVAADLLDVQGDLSLVSATSQTVFDLPTLTPTPRAVQISVRPDGRSTSISAGFQALGDQLWALTLAAGFDPQTSRLAGLFLMDLKTGEAITFGNKIAFSGMSLSKIPILAETYSQLQSPPSVATAVNIANMMVCSENSASNALLSAAGGGDPYQGAQAVTAFMKQLGLGNTYMVAPFLVDPNATPQPIVAPTTQADQVRAEPDYSNQMTVDDIGWLLNGIYQCAASGDGSLITQMPDAFDQRECRQMLDVMSDNNLNEPLLMSAGVPAGTRVAHKHGWTADTHGNAGIVFSPGGDYALVVALHSPTWLDFNESFPLITEISRTVYNYYNPTSPMTEVRSPNIVEVRDCRVAGTSIIDELTSLSTGKWWGP